MHKREDGMVLKPKIYGLHAVENIAGHQFIETCEEANGDWVHVYKAIVVSNPSSHKTSNKNNLFISAIAMISTIYVGAAALVKDLKEFN